MKITTPIKGKEMDTPRPVIIHWIPWKKGDTVTCEGSLIIVIYRDGNFLALSGKVTNNSGKSSFYATIPIPRV